MRVNVWESDFSRDSPIVLAYEFERPLVLDEPREMESDWPLLSDMLTDSVMVVLTDLVMLMVQPLVLALHSIGVIEFISMGSPMPRRTILFGRLSSDGWYGFALMFLLTSGMQRGPTISYLSNFESTSSIVLLLEILRRRVAFGDMCIVVQSRTCFKA